MAVNKTDRFNWQGAGMREAVRFRKASPNLVAGRDFLHQEALCALFPLVISLLHLALIRE